MLSMRNVSAAQGQHYYSKDNYYSKSATRSASQWWGRGAEQLGLSGQVQKQQFKVLLEGYSSDGQQLRAKKKNTQGQNRAALDMTFSAPKSVSLAALVGGDRQLESAHRVAVNRTLELVQSRYAQTRVRTKGDRQSITTGKLVVAQYHHDTSREKEPQLHTHCVVINTTQLENGKWQSLHADSIWRHSKLIGQIYQNELACEVQRLGYEIEPRAHGQFELKGYTTEQLKAFSTRRQQIVNLVGENASRRDKELACLATRQPKGEEIAREELLVWWHSEVEFFGIKHPVPQPGRFALQDAATAVRDGILHCSEREAGFNREAIEKFVLAEVGQFSFTAIQTAIDRDAQLIQTFERRYTTQQALGRELATIRLMQEAKAQVLPIASKEQVERYLENKALTPGQQQAIALSTTTTDRVVAWQGVAGAGKTHALNEFQLIAQACGYTLKGYAPSSEAAKVLEQEVGIESTTVASLLAAGELEGFQSKQIWIVDEAGLLGAKDAYALLQRATHEKARVILVGDTRQLSGVEAGNPFRSLQNAQMQTAYLDRSLRQRILDLKAAVEAIAFGKIVQGFERLDCSNRIAVIPDKKQRLSQIVRDYIALAADERETTIVLAGTNQERLDITLGVREQLKQQGILGATANLTQLKPKDLTQVQARYAHHYAVGDVVVPIREYKRLGLTKFQPYIVEALDKNSLSLRAMNGTRYTVDPMTFRKMVYTQQPIEIAVGDRLRWTRNDREKSRRNGQEFTVVAIEPDNAQIQYKDGSTDKISLTQPLALDYALVSTIYSSQGKTADRVFIATDSTMGKESFYVAVSRAKHELKIYTEDKADLMERAQKSRTKENPLELLRRSVREEMATQPAVTVSQTLQPASVVLDGSPVKSEAISPKPNSDLEYVLETTELFEGAVERSHPTTSTQPFLPSGSPTSVEQPVKTDRNLNHPLGETHEPLKSQQSPMVDEASMRERAVSHLDGDSRTAELHERTSQHSNPSNSGAVELRPNASGSQATSTSEPVKRKDLQSTSRQTRSGLNNHFRQLKEVGRQSREVGESLTALANTVRDIPLEEVAARLGLEPDRHDKHKWRGADLIVSINDQKFYDHLAMKGGYGAIDLVMHVQGSNFKQALDWLSFCGSSLPPQRSLPQQLPQLPATSQSDRQPFQPPTPDKSKWSAVRQYLLEKRGLPASLVDDLHSQGLIYADAKQNAVFLRKSLEGEVTGASLRGTYKDSEFKGLATGSRRDEGWFIISQGQGQLQRIVLVESPIDAMSAAALARQKTGTTMFISGDGAGSIPTEFLQRHLANGGQVIVAYDADKAGEEMAQKAIEVLPQATRAQPAYGKDWNEQLLIYSEARETAQAVQMLLKQIVKDVKTLQPDGTWAFEATNWRFTQRGDIVAIATVEDNREILRVNGGKIVVFNPNPEEREKLKDFRQQVQSDLQKQQREQSQQRQCQQQQGTRL